MFGTEPKERKKREGKGRKEKERKRREGRKGREIDSHLLPTAAFARNSIS